MAMNRDRSPGRKRGRAVEARVNSPRPDRLAGRLLRPDCVERALEDTAKGTAAESAPEGGFSSVVASYEPAQSEINKEGVSRRPASTISSIPPGFLRHGEKDGEGNVLPEPVSVEFEGVEIDARGRRSHAWRRLAGVLMLLSAVTGFAFFRRSAFWPPTRAESRAHRNTRSRSWTPSFTSCRASASYRRSTRYS